MAVGVFFKVCLKLRDIVIGRNGRPEGNLHHLVFTARNGRGATFAGACFPTGLHFIFRPAGQQEHEVSQVIVRIAKLTVSGRLGLFRNIGHLSREVKPQFRTQQITVPVGVGSPFSPDSSQKQLSECAVIAHLLVRVP